VTSTVNSVTTLRCFIKVIGVNPGYGGGHHAEVEMGQVRMDPSSPYAMQH